MKMADYKDQQSLERRKKRYLEKTAEFEKAFKKFIALPPDKMIMEYFQDRDICKDLLDYDDNFYYDYRVYSDIKNYYKKGIISKNVITLVPCKEIFDELDRMGFIDFSLTEKQKENPLRGYRTYLVGKPFDVQEFIKAYQLFVTQNESFAEYKKAKNTNLPKRGYRDINKEYNKENSAKKLGYPRSFSSDLLNVRKAYHYGVSESNEIDAHMRKESVIKALQDAGFDFSLRFADVELPFESKAYADALTRYCARYGNVDIPSTYDFADARRELNYCGNLGAQHALALAVFNGEVINEQVAKQLSTKIVIETYDALGIKKQKAVLKESEVEFDIKQFIKVFKEYRKKYKSFHIDSSFDKARSMAEFGYPRSLFVDACMLVDAYHHKPVKDKKVEKAIANSYRVSDLKTARFDFFPTLDK